MIETGLSTNKLIPSLLIFNQLITNLVFIGHTKPTLINQDIDFFC